ncbi:hypothetical protein FRC19_011421 [Serendipita sp. 401]|nr:hypothetical protein FRC19_011421 [Serendipita sp. 401]
MNGSFGAPPSLDEEIDGYTSSSRSRNDDNICLQSSWVRKVSTPLELKYFSRATTPGGEGHYGRVLKSEGLQWDMGVSWQDEIREQNARSLVPVFGFKSRSGADCIELEGG